MSEPSSVLPEASPGDAVELVGPVSSPPPAERVAESASDPRSELLAMAATLTHTRSNRLLMEYLRLRRAVR